MKFFPKDSAFAVACVAKAHLQQVPFDSSVEDRKETISDLLTGNYVGRMRVAMKQELVKNVLRMSPLPASEPKTRRWEWFEDTAEDTSALFSGSLEDRTAKLQREARDNATDGPQGNGKVPASASGADKRNAQESESDLHSPQPEANLPSKVDTQTNAELKKQPEARSSAGPAPSQKTPQRSGVDAMSVDQMVSPERRTGTQDSAMELPVEPMSPPKVPRPPALDRSADREEGKPAVVSPTDAAEDDKYYSI